MRSQMRVLAKKEASRRAMHARFLWLAVVLRESECGLTTKNNLKRYTQENNVSDTSWLWSRAVC